MRRLLALSALLAIASPLRAQGIPPDSLFDRLVGRWVLRGTIAHQETTHDLIISWMLGREYLMMTEVSRETDAHGAPQYEAVVLFGRNPRTGEYAAQWMDNTGSSAFDPIGTGHARVEGDSVPFLWVYDSTNRFHNTFVYERGTDSWRWVMDNDSAGVRRPFGRVTLTRTRPNR